jgi:MFS family permease
MQAVAGLMAHRWRADFQLSTFQVGNLSAAFFYTYVLLQIPVGLIYDKFKVKWVLGLASLLLAYACHVMAGASCYAEALYARILMGAASSFGFVGMLYLTAQWFEGKQFAMMVGLAESSAMLGVALTEVGMSWLVMKWGWRLTMTFSAWVAFMLSFLVFVFIKDKQKESEETHVMPPIWQTLSHLIREPKVLIYGFYGFAMLSLVNVFGALWGIPFLRHQHDGMHLTQAASLVSMIFIGVAVGCPTISWLCGRVKDPKRIMLGSAILTALLFLSVLYIKSMPLFMLYIILFLVAFFSSSYIQCFDYTKNAVPKAMQGVCLAGTNMMMMLSAPVLQLAVGGALHHGLNYVMSLSLLPLLMALACFFVFLDKRPENQP